MKATLHQPSTIEPTINSISFSKNESALAINLNEAFHKKDRPQLLKELVLKKQAPVNERLSYGLEIRLESDFVASLRILLLGGHAHLTDNKYLQNCLNAVRHLRKSHSKHVAKKYANCIHKEAELLQWYTKTAQIFFDILWDSRANQEVVPIDEGFKNELLQYAPSIRYQPTDINPENGALIISAGLRDTSLVKSVLQKNNPNDKNNGANPNFPGYFASNAACWSAVLLDHETLDVLLNAQSFHGCTAITHSSLLHWVAASASLDNSDNRYQRAVQCLDVLLKYDVALDSKNLYRVPPEQVTTSKFTIYLRRVRETQKRPIALPNMFAKTTSLQKYNAHKSSDKRNLVSMFSKTHESQRASRGLRHQIIKDQIIPDDQKSTCNLCQIL